MKKKLLLTSLMFISSLGLNTSLTAAKEDNLGKTAAKSPLVIKSAKAVTKNNNLNKKSGRNISQLPTVQEIAVQKIFINDIVTKYQLDAAKITKWLSMARKKQSIIDAMNRPAEGVLSWTKYRKIFITEKRIKEGLAFWKKYQVDLARAEKEYGVPAEMIVAIIGVETFYGRIKGNYRVLDALYTLAFYYPKRATFFRAELGHFFRLTEQQQWQPENKIGSYAGAMGYGQFMPSSYISYGVDFDHDGKIDLIDNPLDAIGSVANYFKRHGWKKGARVVVRAHLTNWQASKLASESTKTKYLMKTLTQAGVVTKEKLSPETPVSLLFFDQEKRKEYWVGLKNFYVISRYNRSHMYSLAAYQLSQKLKQQWQKKHPAKTIKKVVAPHPKLKGITKKP